MSKITKITRSRQSEYSSFSKDLLSSYHVLEDTSFKKKKEEEGRGLMWTILKILTEFVTIVLLFYLLGFDPGGCGI